LLEPLSILNAEITVRPVPVIAILPFKYRAVPEVTESTLFPLTAFARSVIAEFAVAVDPFPLLSVQVEIVAPVRSAASSHREHALMSVGLNC
jgi:hypothetical protein